MSNPDIKLGGADDIGLGSVTVDGITRQLQPILSTDIVKAYRGQDGDTVFGRASSVGAGGIYYVSSSGNDSNAGTSSAAPWRTIAKVNASSFQPGDSILFQGGQTFTGAIISPSAGTNTKPITFGSYGGGRATISSGSSNGFTSANQGGIIVRDLTFTGTASTNQGILFTNGLASNVHLQNIQVIGCVVSGYGQNGIAVTGTAGFAGYDDVLIQGCTTSGCCTVATGGNGVSGIYFIALTAYGINSAGTNAAFCNVVIANCISHDNVGTLDTNWSGSGIFVAEALNALITNCLAYANGTSAAGAQGGAVGIWFSDCVECVIDGCESYGTGSTAHIDGDGFDLDGGCFHCTIQNCYSHENAGAGFQIYCYNDGTVTTSDHCSVLNCVSINDGTDAVNRPTGNSSGIMIGSETTATQTNVRVAGNHVYQSNAGAWCVACYHDTSVTGIVTGNSFVVVGALVHVHNVTAPAALIFNGNDYYGTLNVLWNNTTFTSLTAWRAAFPAQEPSALVTT